MNLMIVTDTIIVQTNTSIYGMVKDASEGKFGESIQIIRSQIKIMAHKF